MKLGVLMISVEVMRLTSAQLRKQCPLDTKDLPYAMLCKEGDLNQELSRS